jgi:hypothetical protein
VTPGTPLIVTLALLAACGGARAERDPMVGTREWDGLPLAPRPFAPGIVSGENVWKGSFTPDGDTLYYVRRVPGGPESYGIFASRKQRDGSWSAPARVPLGGDFSDLYPALSPDGKRLVFTSYRPVPGDASPHPNASLWMARRAKGGGWSTPEPLTGLGIAGQYHSQTAFDAAGSLYYSVTNPSERGSPVYVARWNGRAFEEPVSFEPVNRWRGVLGDSLFVWGGRIAPQGRVVILEVSRLDERHRPGPSDLWATCADSTGWTVPRPLPDSVNTAGYENFIFFSPDARRMFFVRGFKELLSVPAIRGCALLPEGRVAVMAVP